MEVPGGVHRKRSAISRRIEELSAEQSGPDPGAVEPGAGEPVESGSGKVAGAGPEEIARAGPEEIAGAGPEEIAGKGRDH